MGDHQHRAVKLPTELVDKIVQRNLTVDVDTLRRLVQDQQLRAAEQGAGKQYALGFTARQLLQRRLNKMSRLNAF